MPTEMTLNDKTQVYWHLSKAYNGRTEKPITAEHLFRRVNQVLLILDPNRPLATRMHQLRNEVIRGPEHEDAVSVLANT